MQTLCVGVSQVSTMLMELVRETLANDPSLWLSEPLPTTAALQRFVAERRPDVVIVGAGARQAAEELGVLLMEHPRMRVLTIVDDGRDSYIYELLPQRMRLGELSPEALLGAVRAARAPST